MRGLTRLGNGDLIVVGSLTWPGNGVARWNGTAWSGVGSGIVQQVLTVTPLANGEFVVGGNFTSGLGFNAQNLARWNGAAWSAFPVGGFGERVLALAARPNGDVVAGGHFATVGAATVRGVARRVGTTWSPLGTGTSNATFPAQPGYVTAVLPLPNDQWLVGGDFGSVGGVSSSNVARWNGSAWTALGAGLPLRVYSLARTPNGDLFAGLGNSAGGGNPPDLVYRWNGTAWSPIGTAVIGTMINALATLQNGDLVAGGNFQTISGVPAARIARWNGTSWSPLGAGCNNEITSLAVLPDGTLVAGGWFTSPGNRVARWDGATWSPLGSGLDDGVNALAALPDGSVIAGGRFLNAGGSTATRIARWNGAAWSTFGAGVTGGFPEVFALAALPNGNVLVGGTFLVAGASASAYLAELTTTCPATATSGGPGCVGPNGPLVLLADALPWLGATCRTRATGLPNGALGFVVTGLAAANVPLATIHPAAGPGCAQLVRADVLELRFAAGGAVTWSLSIPSDPALVGLPLRQQVVPVTLDATSQITGVYATNALVMTLGVF